jgi:hypothetical protein
MAPEQDESQNFMVDEGSGLALMVGDDGALLQRAHEYNLPLDLRRCLALVEEKKRDCNGHVEVKKRKCMGHVLLKNREWIVACIARWEGRADAAGHDTFFGDVRRLMKEACCNNHQGKPDSRDNVDSWKLVMLQTLGRNASPAAGDVELVMGTDSQTGSQSTTPSASNDDNDDDAATESIEGRRISEEDVVQLALGTLKRHSASTCGVR